MKSTTFAVAIGSLLALVSAQPHRVRHAQAHERLAKKDDVVVTVLATVYAQATEVPDVIVYVDQDGKPVSTTTESAATPTIWSTAVPAQSSSTSVEAAPAIAAVQVESKSSTSAISVVTTTPVTYTPATYTPATYTPVATTSSTTSASPTYSTGGSSGFGLVYSPYNSDGSCKSQSQVETDFKSISTDYKLIRTYGVDCDQVATVLSVVKARGIKLFAGIYDISDLSSAVSTISSAANGDWSNFDTISVGNELVNSGSASAATVVAAIGTVRSLLKAAGYTGNVVTVDTLVAARSNPSLCDESDYCAVNCHPFFDGGVAAADSGKFLEDQLPTLQEKLANKNQKIVVTETGWPWKGDTNGAAVPSLDNQDAAISSIKSSFSSSPESVILFTAFNDMWKSNSASTFDAEQYWGLGGNNAPSG